VDKMTEAPSIDALLSVMARLRDKETGCPWDVLQDFSTIAPYTVEESYEVADAIRRGPEPAMLADELGDLLLQVVYHSRMAEERGWFRFEDVAAGSAAKMIRRHPHVFGDADASKAVDIWEAQKATERAARAETGVLAGIATGLPGLTRAAKLTKRAARVGFDWPDAGAVLDKLEEEAAELRAELPKADPARLADEVGDLLFVLANLARKLDLDPEVCIDGANRKFERRFGAVEASLAAEGRPPADATLDEMEECWREAKRQGL
jgi:ATP diphosphatase